MSQDLHSMPVDPWVVCLACLLFIVFLFVPSGQQEQTLNPRFDRRQQAREAMEVEHAKKTFKDLANARTRMEHEIELCSSRLAAVGVGMDGSLVDQEVSPTCCHREAPGELYCGSHIKNVSCRAFQGLISTFTRSEVIDKR